MDNTVQPIIDDVSFAIVQGGLDRVSSADGEPCPALSYPAECPSSA
ncbi:hypothetical protein [Niveibacterium terrae]